MPGARHPSFRLGDRTQLLAELCLNTIAFTTSVPRQEDVGHDFFCVLCEARDGLLWAGPSFTVQVKSDSSPLKFEKNHEIDWVRELENPFFLVVGDRDKLRIDVYSTWARLNGFLEKAAHRILLRPGPPEPGRGQVWTEDDGSEQVISLGNPVISATVHEFMDKGRAELLSRVLKQWILLDRENIVNSQAGMYWVIGPEAYQTNELFSPDTRLTWIYWNAKNLDRCGVNFGRATAALRLTLRNVLGAANEDAAEFADRIRTLDAALRAYSEVLDPPSQKALKDYIGLNPDDQGRRPPG